MYRRSSHGKEQVIGLTPSPISKRTRHSSDDFNNRRFKTLLNFQSFTNNFESAPIVVEGIVPFDTLGSTFIPNIFTDKDWTNLFRNFDDPIDKLVNEFYLNTYSPKLNWSVGSKEKILSSLQIILRRYFTSNVQQMQTFHHMMTN